ncbi:MAG: Rrf2 family transcriptional regulator [Chloroflexota bacterium]|nr:Rrf2 family transcriptional regulator [Chloroflexota bacterium]
MPFNINRETDYAIRVILALSKRIQGVRVSSSVVQEEMLIPKAISQRIIAKLAQAGFINTFFGRKGGIELAHPPSDISLHQIVELFEGSITVSECITEDNDCPFTGTCPVQKCWISLRSAIVEELESTNFEDLALEAQSPEQVVR